METPELVAALRAAGLTDVRDDATTRAVYSSDASLYRAVPQVVALPQHPDEIVATLSVCRELGVPLTARGAGTSIAGNAVGTGVVMDVNRYLNQVLDVDLEAGTARVQPGTVHATLQRAVTPHGWRFGPDPSTHTRCSIAGMIGNNACGTRALGYGRAVDNVEGLKVVTGTGALLTLNEPGAPAALQELVQANLAPIRTELGRFTRQVSGYSLEHLLPERGFDLRRALVGSEGTLAITLEATVNLVRTSSRSLTVVLGYPSIGDAGDAVPGILPFSPIALEGMDRRIVNILVNRRGPSAVPELPEGDAWLLAELVGEDATELEHCAGQLIRAGAATSSRMVPNQREAVTLWKIREDGAGLAGRSVDNRPAHSGWEDAAVPPAQLGAYLREFDELCARYDIHGVPYGHFGDGCVHVRLDFPFDRPEGRYRYRAFMFDAAELVARHGGSCSGEHGDGRVRSELLPTMYSPAVISLFEQVKATFDPGNILNPGILVNPHPIDTDIRVTQAPPVRTGLAFAYQHDGGDLSQAVHRCTGVGKCRVDTRHTGGVMCPSYLATGEDKDSTRGRARALQEMMHATDTPDWRDPAVHEALDLCLSCKGCHSDCPTGIDMAAYKSEVLHQAYRGRLRPISHYTLGWLPRWTRLVGLNPKLLAPIANRATRIPFVRDLALRAAGVDPRRGVPEFAVDSFRNWWRDRPASRGKRPVLLWVDSFTEAFAPQVAIAAVQVLEDAGYAVQIPNAPVCCGLTWITTGQLDAARSLIGGLLQVTESAVAAGIPIVGLEPSCTAVLRSDAVELLGERARPLADATVTLAELLTSTPGWTPPDLNDMTAIAQPHCHHHAVLNWDTDAKLLQTAGASVQRLGGCCGLAGNFGVELGHYDVSLKVADQQLIPSLNSVKPGTVVLADGFSCRTQIADLTDQRGVHLAELLAERLPRD